MKLTNLDKIYWKQDKITKGDLIEYYGEVAPVILPYLKGRPLTLHRFPEGVGGEHFYQKQAPSNLPSFVKTKTIQHTDRATTYILAENAKTLLYVANLGSIELHPFLSTVQHLDQPDYLVLDLDPTGISFNAVIETAQAAHEILEKAKIKHFCKTSGGTGLHIYLPLKAKYDYTVVKQFAWKVAKVIHEALPGVTSLERNPAKRKRKVYIDTLQNEHSKSVVAPYSVRGAAHATVSTPLEWKEVKRGLDPEEFTIFTIPKRLKQKGDLFKGVLGKGIIIK